MKTTVRIDVQLSWQDRELIKKYNEEVFGISVSLERYASRAACRRFLQEIIREKLDSIQADWNV